jgi:hypothetical protein
MLQLTQDSCHCMLINADYPCECTCLRSLKNQKTLVSMCVRLKMVFLSVIYHTCHWCSWWDHRLWKVLYADVTWLIMLTLVRSNTLRLQEIDGNFSVIFFPQRCISKIILVPYYDNIWPTWVVTNWNNFLSYSWFKDPKVFNEPWLDSTFSFARGPMFALCLQIQCNPCAKVSSYQRKLFWCHHI